MTEIKLKRCYEPEAATDGFRIYIDRLWPRGLSHETFHYNVWEKDIAPSDTLRHWFHENPDANWIDFEKKYRAEILDNPAWKPFVKTVESHQVVTLLYSSRNEQENNAIVIQSLLTELHD